MDDKVVFFRQLCKRADIIGQIDRRCLRQTPAGRDVRIDIIGLDVHAVAQRLAVHAHIEGQQADVVPFQLLRAEITGRVRRDLITHREFLPFFHLHPLRTRVW